jgi:hypothetical protein
VGSLQIALIVFACVFGGAMLGLLLRAVLPENHLSSDSKDVIKLATGLIATMSALVLGLLVSSAKGTFDLVNGELMQTAANIVLLDRVLAQYGPETREARDGVKSIYTNAVEQILSNDETEQLKLDTPEAVNRAESLQARLLALSPQNAAQRWLQSRALEIAGGLSHGRWLLIIQKSGSISMPLLLVLVSWLTIIFTSFGLFARRNLTVVAALLVSALCVSGAIFLILEMDRPISGFMKVSSGPMRAAIAHLGED